MSFEEFVTTQDGSVTLRHPAYDEEFHSIQGARFEADCLYMEASGFRQRMNSDGRTEAWGVLDVGLGLGYNALMTIECWMQGLGAADLELVSLEQTRELVASLADPACGWKKGWSKDWLEWSVQLSEEADSEFWRGHLVHPRSGRSLRWLVIVGDARLANLARFAFDYIWQDAFSPKKNGELWSVEWFQKLHAVSHSQVELVSYSVARMVRDHMEAAGWAPERVKAREIPDAVGPVKKRWLRARRAAG